MPPRHPHVFALGFFSLLSDSAARWKSGGKDAMCTNCFSLHRSPTNGEENLKTHLKSCNPEWWAMVKARVEASGAVGRHAKPVADDGTLALPYDRRMELNMDCALAFAALGNIPTSLVDNPIYIEHQRNVSGGTWVPPSSQFIRSDGPALEIAEDMVIIEQKQVISMAMMFYKGVACIHASTDAWTARGGWPFLGTDLNLIAPWNATRSLTGLWSGDVRHHIATKLQHLQGSHNGERIALCIVDGLQPYGIVPAAEPVVLPADNYNERTNLSRYLASWTTDCGGGVPAAPRRMGGEHGECSLHRCDTTLLNVIGLAQKTTPPELVPVRDLFKKVFALCAHFTRGTCTQRNELFHEIAAEVELVEEAVRMLGSSILDDAPEDLGNSSDKDDPGDDSQPYLKEPDAFLDPEVEVPDEELRRRKIKKHVRHVKTRCWSAVASASSIRHLARKNTAYFARCPSEAHMNLLPNEYNDLSHVLGVVDDIVDIERHSEGSSYDTSSIFHPITLDIRERLREPTVWCPDPMCAEGSMIEVAVEGMGAIGKQAVRSAISELDRCFGDEPSTLAEAKTQYCDPRLKRMERYTQRDVQTGRPAMWERARAAVKRDIVTMIEFDRAAERARLMRAEVRDTAAAVGAAAAAAPASAAAAPPTGTKRKKPSLGSGNAAAAAGPPSPAAAAEAAITQGERRPEEMAEDELLWWDRIEDLKECQRDLMPTDENPTVLNLIHYHLEYMHVKKGPAYFHRAALAALGRTASAAETERYFRAVAFVNSLGRQSQKPPTIARLAFLHRNRSFLPKAEAMVAEFKKRAKMRHAEAQRAKEEARVARNAAAGEVPSVGAVDDGAAVFVVDDAESPESAAWDSFLAGLDADDVREWVDADFAAAAAATEGVPVLCVD